MKKIHKKFLASAIVLTCIMPTTLANHLQDRPQIDKKPNPVNAETVSAMEKPAVLYTEFMRKDYKGITKDDKIMQALEIMKGTIGNYSREAIMGNNLSNKKIKIEFKNLMEINPKYSSFDALGWKKSGRLYIYINQKHQSAPPEALAALLAHEALHQDELDSLNEETYAWTMEAAVWTQLTEKNPMIMNNASALVNRENMLKKLFEKGEYTNKYIKKAVFSNAGYKTLPTRSPGFEDSDIEDL